MFTGAHHPMYNIPMPLMWLSLAFLLGILAASLFPLPWAAWLGLGCGGVFLAVVERRLRPQVPFLLRLQRHSRLALGALLAAFFFGAARLQAALPAPTPHDAAWYNGRGDLRLAGVVTAPPDVRERNVRLRVRVEGITPAGRREAIPVSGGVLAVVHRGGEWQVGDRVLLIGRLETPPENEDFSYKDYLARQGLHSLMEYPGVLQRTAATGGQFWFQRGLFRLRQQAYDFINRSIPQPEAALLAGILLGLDDDIPPSLMEAFRETGTSHIIAISGFNIAILAGLFGMFTRRLLPPLPAAVAAVAGIAVYSLMVGGQASVVRAAIMGGMGLFGHVLGRRQSGLNSLAFTGAVMCLFNPLLPWDAGFQLSFSATLGLVLFAEPLQESFIRLAERFVAAGTARRLAGPVGEYFLFTLAAQVTTLPVLVATFGRLSLSGLLANPLILPLQPAVMILGGLAVIGGLVFEPLGWLLAQAAWLPLAYTTRMTELLARMPGGMVASGPPGPLSLGLYALLVALLASRPPLKTIRKWIPMALLLALFTLAVLAWKTVVAAPQGRLSIVLLPLQDGPALLIRSPAGGRVLLEGSSSSRELGSALARRLPPLDHRLDAVVLANASGNALEGLPVTLERFPPGLVWAAPSMQKYRRWQDLQTWFQHQGTSLDVMEPGETLDLGGGVRLEALQVNQQGAALLVRWGRFRALFPGGAPPQSLPEGATAGLPVIVLSARDLKEGGFAPWQESRPLLGVECDPRQDDPDWLALERYAWLEIRSDGERMWVEGGRPD